MKGVILCADDFAVHGGHGMSLSCARVELVRGAGG